MNVQYVKEIAKCILLPLGRLDDIDNCVSISLLINEWVSETGEIPFDQNFDIACILSSIIIYEKLNANCFDIFMNDVSIKIKNMILSVLVSKR